MHAAIQSLLTFGENLSCSFSLTVGTGDLCSAGGAAGAALSNGYNDETGQLRGQSKEGTGRLLRIGPPLFCTGTQSAESAPHLLAQYVWMVIPEKVVVIGGGRLDTKDIDLDSIPGTLSNGAVQFVNPPLIVLAVLRDDLGGKEITEMGIDPNAVDAVVSQPVEIALGIVVYIVSQLLAVFRWTVGRTEKAAG